MDPYLERHWGDVHHRLIQYACDSLQPRLPEDLLARIEERVFVESVGERTRRITPDVHVTRVYPLLASPPAALHEGEAVVAEPLCFDLADSLTSEGYIEIRDSGGGKVVTVIEFLSPANKSAGHGQVKYLEKQTEVLRSDANLIEIDLVRTGERVLALPANEIPARHRSDYLACVSPGSKRNRRELYPMPLRERLPRLPIPLRPGEPGVLLDLQELVDQAYASGRYHNLDYTNPLQPPPSPDDAARIRELLVAR